ncbi:hypothetical protein FOA43_002840 [Brettanomyces nanus]|uniref:Zn(2)-C6 fungal-type domain-containing protein n=1 Tax=Eeniella nana TaxID=13502 RepID=A0A875S551_EENNA|nr:uncharacterized protein FOA43_002840 [Brettanomyces nanus]QPG75485.1 hypothetical protein FOA43_002840 [Brettanomyces nanus]
MSNENDSLLCDIFKFGEGPPLLQDELKRTLRNTNRLNLPIPTRSQLDKSNEAEVVDVNDIDAKSRSGSLSEDSSSAQRKSSNGIEKPMQKNKKKKRRVFSCNNCRKLKTKCTYEPNSTCCDRCHRLRLSCSLPEPLAKISGRRVYNSTTSQTGSSSGLETRIDDLELNLKHKFESFDSKMDTMMEMIHRMDSSATVQTNQSSVHYMSTAMQASASSYSSRILPRYNSLSSLNVINQIHSRLFDHSPKNNDAFHESIQEFIKFYYANEELCLALSKEFLNIAHFWIIPGGIGEVDREYVIKHPFSSCVYCIIAMGFDNDYKFVEQKKELYPIARSLMVNTSLTIPLSDHDIEAVLYVCTYGMTKQAYQSEFDGWILSSLAFKHCIISLDLQNILNRVKMGVFSDDDIFHLRIFNAVCCCHYQFAVGYDRPVMMDLDYVKLHQLILQFPNATIGDAIKVAELELYQLLSRDLVEMSPGDVYCQVSEDNKLTFAHLIDWLSNWDKIIAKDVTHGLIFSYNFAHLLLARKFIQAESQVDHAILPLAYNTACQYSFEIINQLLALPEAYVRGSPLFHLSHIVYSCVTLFDFLDVMKPSERKKSLNLISKVYWHLNKAGEKINVATDSIAQIIRKLVELASKHQYLEYNNKSGFVGSGSITETYVRMKHIKRRDSQQQRRLSVEDLPALAQDHRRRCSLQSSPKESSETKLMGGLNDMEPMEPIEPKQNDSTKSSVHSGSMVDGAEFQLPDVSNFLNFEDFFYNIFNDSPDYI